MIICSCNVLSEAQILAALKCEGGERLRSAGETYRCLGCAPRCGRCVATVRRLVAEAHLAHCQVGCPTCPAAHDHNQDRVDTPAPFLIAAE